VLEKLKLPKNVQALYRTEGKVMVKDRPETCPVCGGTGYYGQVAAFAVHPIRADDRRHIAAGDEQSLRGAWRQRDEPSIQTAALQLLVEGKTSVDELVRVLQGGGKKSSGSSKQKQAAAKPAAAGAES
jgi:type II secretory ATPase GspE/PulE/Tfp pilus assembly ATPase PilB-like protein